MADVLDFKSGYEQITSMKDDVRAREDLSKAYEQTQGESDPKTGEVTAAKDMFKVNSLAAQMAAQQGNLKAAEKFDKQAQDSKASAIQNQLNDMKVQAGKFEMFDKTLQTINTAEDGINVALKSDLPDEMKMRAVAMFKEAGDDPKKLEAIKEKFQDASIDGQHRLTAAQKVLQMQLKHEEKTNDQALKLLMVQTTAGAQSASLSERTDFHDRELSLRERELASKQEKADSDVLTNFDKLEIAASKIKDPEARKTALKRLNKRRQDAEDRMAGRDVPPEGQADSKGRFVAKPGVPPEADWIKAAKKANPDVSDEDLKNYYKKTYGRK